MLLVVPFRRQCQIDGWFWEVGMPAFRSGSIIDLSSFYVHKDLYDEDDSNALGLSRAGSSSDASAVIKLDLQGVAKA